MSFNWHIYTIHISYNYWHSWIYLAICFLFILCTFSPPFSLSFELINFLNFFIISFCSTASFLIASYFITILVVILEIMSVYYKLVLSQLVLNANTLEELTPISGVDIYIYIYIYIYMYTHSVHGILHARILEWIAMPTSRGSSWPKDWTQVSCIASKWTLYHFSHKGSLQI